MRGIEARLKNSKVGAHKNHNENTFFTVESTMRPQDNQTLSMCESEPLGESIMVCVLGSWVSVLFTRRTSYITAYSRSQTLARSTLFGPL